MVEVDDTVELIVPGVGDGVGDGVGVGVGAGGSGGGCGGIRCACAGDTVPIASKKPITASNASPRPVTNSSTRDEQRMYIIPNALAQKIRKTGPPAGFAPSSCGASIGYGVAKD
jgi:hypothetical protein